MKMKIVFIIFVLVLFASILFSAVFFGDIHLGQLIRYIVGIGLLIGGVSLLAAFLVSVVSSRKSANRFLSNASLLVVTSTLLLVAGEYGLRYLY
jgi:hypothetical protein